MQGSSANLCYIHSWFLIGSICTSNDQVCKVPLQTKWKRTHHLVGGWQGQVRRCLKPFMPSICSLRNGFTLIEDGLRFLNHLTSHIFSHKKRHTFAGLGDIPMAPNTLGTASAKLSSSRIHGDLRASRPILRLFHRLYVITHLGSSDQ